MSGLALRVGRPWAPTRLMDAVTRSRRSATATRDPATGDPAAGDPAAGDPAAGSLLGIEHEYRVLGPDGTPVDFRVLLPMIPVPGRALDPADRHALRLPWGAALTADAGEAEVALPPLAVRPGTATLAASLAERALTELAAILPAGHRLDGYSTHLSVAMPTGVAEAAAYLYARAFAPALMLLLDGRDAPGLLVRPRPGRLELGGDFRAGDGLSAAATFALGSALAAARAVSAARPRPLPPLVEVRPEPAVERYGWYVDRAAFGADLYAGGRATPLPLKDGGSMAAGEHLARAWAVARRELRGRAGREELRLVDELVAGRRALPLEAADRPATTAGAADAGATDADAVATDAVVATTATGAGAFRAPEGHLLDDIVRPGFAIRATLATWELAVFEVTGARRAIVAVPRRELGAFLASASTGLLDGPLERFLARPSRGDILRTRTEALAGTRAWDGIGDPRALIAEEPDGTGHAAGTGPVHGPGRAGDVGRLIGGGARAAIAAGRLAGIDIDGPELPDDRPGKRSRRRRDDDRRDEHHEDPSARPPARPRTRPETPQSHPAVAPAGGLPIIPIVGGIVAVVGVVAVLVVSGVLGGGTQPPSAPAATLVAAVTAAPSASDLLPAQSPDASVAAPGGSVDPAPPLLAEARIEGTYNDGPDDSYRISVTPACDVGACDGSAVILSLPFEAGGPRAAISMPFVGTAGSYSGEGTAPIPVCRAAGGQLLTSSPTYRLEGFHALEQAVVDGRWIATSIAGTVTISKTSASAGGTTCTTGGSESVTLGWNDPNATPAPSPTAAPLALARFEGNYAPTSADGSRFDAAPACLDGPCDVKVTLNYWIDASVKKTTTTTMAYDGTAYTGQATFNGLRCSNGARANVTIELRGFTPTVQSLVGDRWTATRLEGTFVRKKFKQTSGPGCFGATESSPFTLNLHP